MQVKTESGRVAWIRKNKKLLAKRAQQQREAQGGQFYWER